MFLKQDVMRRVIWSLLPLYAFSVYLYGWRALALGATVFGGGILAEYIMEKARNKKVSEAVLVTCLLFTLSLPPAVPLWVALVGILFAVVFAKGVFGGFGRNIFNPAVGGRLFIYISFPLLMQTTWMLPGNFGLLGMNHQATGSGIAEALLVLLVLTAVFLLVTRKQISGKALVVPLAAATVLLIAGYVVLSLTGLRASEIDVVSTATPLELIRGAQWTSIKPGQEYLAKNDLLSLFLGFRAGSLGESAIFLIVAAAIYLLITKTANWKTMIPALLAALVLTAVFYYTGALAARQPLMNPVGKDFLAQLADIARLMMSGSLLFVVVFMVTDPVSGPNKPVAQVIYGILIGSVIVVIRSFSGFPEGTSFAVLLGNTFANLLDEYSPAPKKKAVAPQAAKEASR